MTFPAQSPDLRRFPLVAGASRSVVRSPRSAAPRIRFLFVDSRVRFTLRSAYASRRTPCASLRSLRPGSGRTFTSKSSPMPGPPRAKGATRLMPGRPSHSSETAKPYSESYGLLLLNKLAQLHLKQRRGPVCVLRPALRQRRQLIAPSVVSSSSLVRSSAYRSRSSRLRSPGSRPRSHPESR